MTGADDGVVIEWPEGGAVEPIGTAPFPARGRKVQDRRKHLGMIVDQAAAIAALHRDTAALCHAMRSSARENHRVRMGFAEIERGISRLVRELLNEMA